LWDLLPQFPGITAPFTIMCLSFQGAIGGIIAFVGGPIRTVSTAGDPGFFGCYEGH